MKSKGFTIVELLVTTGIMAVLMGGALVMMSRFNATQKIRSAKEEMISSLSLARSYAKGMQIPAGVSGNLKYITIGWDANLNMTIKAVTDQAEGVLVSKKLVQGGGVNVSPTLGLDTLCFAAYETKLVDQSGRPSDVGVSFAITSVEGVGGSEVVRVSTSGLINEK